MRIIIAQVVNGFRRHFKSRMPIFLGLLLLASGVLSGEQPNLIKRGGSTYASPALNTLGSGTPVGPGQGQVVRSIYAQPQQLGQLGAYDHGQQHGILQLESPAQRYHGGRGLVQQAVELEVPESVVKGSSGSVGSGGRIVGVLPQGAAYPAPEYSNSPHPAPNPYANSLYSGPSPSLYTQAGPHQALQGRVVGYNRGVYSGSSEAGTPAAYPFGGSSVYSPKQYSFNQPIHTLGPVTKVQQSVGVSKGVPTRTATSPHSSGGPSIVSLGPGQGYNLEEQEGEGPVILGSRGPSPSSQYILQGSGQGPPPFLRNRPEGPSSSPQYILQGPGQRPSFLEGPGQRPSFLEGPGQRPSFLEGPGQPSPQYILQGSEQGPNQGPEQGPEYSPYATLSAMDFSPAGGPPPSHLSYSPASGPPPPGYPGPYTLGGPPDGPGPRLGGRGGQGGPSFLSEVPSSSSSLYAAAKPSRRHRSGPSYSFPPPPPQGFVDSDGPPRGYHPDMEGLNY